MNERIKELMNQTGVPVSMPFDKWCEKFAELIVRESAEMLACEYGQSATSGNEAAIFIRNHFGVKE